MTFGKNYCMLKMPQWYKCRWTKINLILYYLYIKNVDKFEIYKLNLTYPFI